MSCREQERVWQRIDGLEVTQNYTIWRLAVSSIDWLGLLFMDGNR
jgi:hypothetical protein